MNAHIRFAIHENLAGGSFEDLGLEAKMNCTVEDVCNVKELELFNVVRVVEEVN